MDRDPVCGKKMNPNKAHITIQYNGMKYYLCCPLCQAEFENDPEKYIIKELKRKAVKK
jgi:YHS domain-containing protein